MHYRSFQNKSVYINPEQESLRSADVAKRHFAHVSATTEHMYKCFHFRPYFYTDLATFMLDVFTFHFPLSYYYTQKATSGTKSISPQAFAPPCGIYEHSRPVHLVKQLKS